MCCVIFEHASGLKIIGEIQIHDKVLHDLKSKVRALQDVVDAVCFV